MDPHPATATEPLAGLLYQTWPQSDGSIRVEFLSADAEAVLELSADELGERLNARTLPLTGVDAGEFYRHVAESAAAHASWRAEVGYVGPRTGRLRWLQIADFPRRTADGTPYFSGVIIDITPLKAAEERLKTALEFNRQMAWDYDASAGRIYRSRHFGEFFGVPELGANPGPDFDSLCAHPADRERVKRVVAESLAAGECVRLEFRGATDAPDGTPRWFEVNGQVVRDAAGRVVRAIGVTADVTERKRAEREREALDRQLTEARRYDSLGVLAGGIAHDFNNLLTVILGNAAVARTAAAAGSPLAGCLADIEAAGQRAAHLCSQLTAYAGVGRLAVGPVDLAALLRQVEPVLRADAGRAALTVRAAADLPQVTGEAFQIRQAVRNLVTNAGEAVGSGDGAVLIEVEETAVSASARSVGDDPLAPPAAGRYLLLRVTDTGGGMTADTAARAFDPFFSTKFAGRGLGLAAVRGIVKGHKGGIRVRSTPGQGTTVELLLPVAPVPMADAVVPLSTGSSAISAPARRPRTGPPPHVLVVDDEANIRELISSLLEDDGMTVEAAGDGAEAVRVFAEHPARYSLAVVDLLMPGMNGQDVIRKLRELKPGLPAVVVSGFSDRELPADVRTGGPTAVLPKPFRIEQFSAVVNAALGTQVVPA